MPLNRSAGSLFLVVATVTAAFLALQPKLPGQKADLTKPQDAASKSTSVPEGGPLRPVWEFLNAKPDDAPCPRSPASASPWTDWPRAKAWQRSKATISFLIVTVPDPADSGLPYMFDQVVEAVQRALEMDRYVIDHRWLPWVRPEFPAKADGASKVARSPSRRHRNEPGLILFRKSVEASRSNHQHSCPPPAAAPAHQLLGVFVVGETPTSGVHRPAFAKAVELIERCPCSVKEQADLRVLGPYFSGSQTSLALALAEVRSRPLRVTATYVAGFANIRLAAARIGAVNALLEGPSESAFPRIHVVCGSASAVDRESFCAPWRRDGDSFETTIHADKLLRKWLYKFLDNPTNPAAGSQPDRLVVLQETNTGFGQVALQHGKECGAGKNVYTIPYPMHISQLRASYTRAQLAKLESLGLPRATWDLPFPQAESEKTAEVLPVQDPLMTTAMNSLVVNNLVQTMAHWQARHVCLVATDARDAVFLAGLIRDRNPDVQLCATGGNLLYTHQDYRYALWGMVVASTYPLHPTVQGWGETASPPNGHRVQFADETYQGCFNATLVHLHAAGSSRALEHLLDYGAGSDPGGPARPGIWISAVGQNGEMIPLHRVSPAEIATDCPDGSYLPYERKPPTLDVVRRDVALPTVWVVVMVFALTAAALWYYLCGQLASVATEATERRRLDGQKRGIGIALAGVALVVLYAWSERVSLDQSASSERATLPKFWWFLLVALSMSVLYLLKHAYQWIVESRWRDDVAGRLAAYKQRIDFALAGIAVVVLYAWLTKVALIALYYREPGFWSHLSPFLAASACLAMMVLVEVLIVRVYWRRRDGSWIGWRQRGRAYREDIAKSRPLRGLADYWFRSEPPRPGAGSADTSQRDLPEGRQYYWLRAGLYVVAGEILFFVVALVGIPCYYGSQLVSVCWTLKGSAPQHLLNFERLTSPPTGLSPLLPVLLLCAAVFAWGFFLVKKQYLACSFSVRCPFPADGTGEFQRLADLDRTLGNELMPPSTWQQHPLGCALVLGLLLVAFWKLGDEATLLIDGAWFSWVTRWGGFFVGAFLLVFTLLQVGLAWRAFRQLLHRLAELPMAAAFGRLPEKAVHAFGQYFGNLRRRMSYQIVVRHQVGLFRRLFPACRARLRDVFTDPSSPPFLQAAAKEFGTQFPEWKEDLASTLSEATDEQAIEEDLRGTITQPSLAVLQHLWPAQSLREAFGGPAPEAATQREPLYLSLPEDDPVRKWAVAAEDHVALQIGRYVSQFSVQLRNLLLSMSIGSLLLLLAAVSYPFRPQYLLLLVLTALCGAVAILVVLFLVQVNRDELVSRIRGSTPNQFTPDLSFFEGTMKYVAPIVGGLLLQIPFVTSTLRSLFEPLIHIIH